MDIYKGRERDLSRMRTRNQSKIDCRDCGHSTLKNRYKVQEFIQNTFDFNKPQAGLQEENKETRIKEDK